MGRWKKMMESEGYIAWFREHPEVWEVLLDGGKVEVIGLTSLVQATRHNSVWVVDIGVVGHSVFGMIPAREVYHIESKFIQNLSEREMKRIISEEKSRIARKYDKYRQIRGGELEMEMMKYSK